MSGNDPTMLSGPKDESEADGDEAFCSACNQSYPMDVERCPRDGARLTKLKARPDELLGRVFDSRYEVRTSLGAGGMGTVYRGWQLSVDREVAIKVIHAKLGGDRTVVKRFLREARLSSRLSQPNIVNVYDFGQADDGILYIVMELIRGRTLGKDLEAQRPLPLKRITTIAGQLCDALEAAHGQGIVHRDLKPGNIMILDEPPGRDLLKVLDFGLSKSLASDSTSLVTQSSALLGTPLYMPPEQIEGKASDQRGDLYSVGCILYQMATGRPPFVGTNVNTVLAAHISEPVPPLPASVPAQLADLIVQLMQKSPDRRPASAGLVRDALQGIAASGHVDVADTSPDISVERRRTGPVALAATMAATTSSLPSPSRRPKWHWLAGGFSIAGVAVVAMIALGGNKSSPDAGSLMQGNSGSGGGAKQQPLSDAAMFALPVEVDAALADAPPPPPIDAAVHHQLPVKRPSPVDAGVVARPPDAAVAIEPHVIAPHPIDAGGLELNFVPTPHKKD